MGVRRLGAAVLLAAVLVTAATPPVAAKQRSWTTATDEAPWSASQTTERPPFSCNEPDVCRNRADNGTGALQATMVLTSADGSPSKSIMTRQSLHAGVSVEHAKDLVVRAVVDVDRANAITSVVGPGESSMSVVAYVRVAGSHPDTGLWLYHSPVTVLAEAADGSVAIGDPSPRELTLSVRLPDRHTGKVSLLVTVEQVGSVASEAGGAASAVADVDTTLTLVSVTYR